MSDTSDQVKDALIDAVADLAVQRYRDAGAGDPERMIRQYYNRIAPQDIVGKDPIDLYASAVRHWQLGARRRPTESLIRVYNPHVDEDGWGSTHTVIDVITDDMPFIVDSVLAMLEIRNLQVHVLVHPMAGVVRDEEGVILSIHEAEADSDLSLESFLHLEIDRVASGVELESLRKEVAGVLGDVRSAVEDWPAMRERARALAEELEGWAEEAERGTPRFEASVGTDPYEVAALLRWMDKGSFTFVGYREYDFEDNPGHPTIVVRPGTGLGNLRESAASVRDLGLLPAEIAELARRPSIVNLTKANAYSTVHRAVPLDYVGIKDIDENGVVVGERRFLGLFTSTVYSGRVEDIPVVRAKVNEVIRRARFHPGSHDRSRLLNILQLYPRDELFQIEASDLEEMALDILDLRDRRQVSLLIRRDAFGRFLSCMVYVPRDRHSTDVRLEIQRVLMDAYHGTSCRFSTEISDAPLARLHIVIYVDPASILELPDPIAVQARLNRVIRNWDDYLRSALVETHGEDRGLRLYERYRTAFPGAYRDEVLAESAVSDIDWLEELGEAGLDVRLHHPLEAGPHEMRCKLYRNDDPITLTQFIPLLHDLGATVTDERPYEIDVEGERPRFIYDIGLRLDRVLDAQGRGRFRDALLAVWLGASESDGFARLITNAGLTWQEVGVLRAYARYLVQVGARFSPTYVQDTLTSNPNTAARLMALFRLRFEPEHADKDAAVMAAAELSEAIDRVESLDADRILRSFVALINATIRTNHWRDDPPADILPALALKLDPERVPDIPKPVPAAEIFVYSPRTEGVHLRAGRVARGGLRWSDRMEDFRTEILGLMKAQTVKNSVIVPVGAKGGFVVKQLPTGDRELVMEEVVACYRSFISALLDVTDNLVDGKVVPPELVIRHDGDDPYLVVAADKGTATFSDIANRVAESRGFWLGDAFASGGSAGYDHKALSITARGAWVSVERHFRELDVDVATNEFLVAGVGDMSGDVFGNGMLRSSGIRLVAAFDHRHVFVDPSPDAARSFEERARLFTLPRSSWDDYDRSLISEGGGVFPRSAKSVPISEPMGAALGIDPSVRSLTPNELISAILRAPVDLLWNGGIGTYVKASSETHSEVGDRSNDAVRVDAAGLCCRVIGEGGNLGVTQQARIEFARGGGLINTDAIDNSGGVDCSDHEVNLKILLSQAVRDGDLTTKQRDGFLDSMADDVCGLVLDNNYAQNETLSAAVLQAPGMVEVHMRLLAWLEENAGLDRGLEALPSDVELQERRIEERGLTRPELSVLMAYVKNQLIAELTTSTLPADASFEAQLTAYFPELVRDQFGPLIVQHPLRGELLSTVVANHMVNRGGVTMVHRLAGETSATSADIARAHAAAWQIYELEPVWLAVRQLDNVVRSTVQTAMQLEIKRLGERSTRWLLRNEAQPLDIEEVVDTYGRSVHELHEIVLGGPGLETASADGSSQVEVAAMLEAGVPSDLARAVASLGPAFGFLDLSAVALRTGADLERVAAIYGGLEAELSLGWLRQQIIALPRDDHWQTMARSALRDEFFLEHAELTAAVVGIDVAASDPNEQVREWLAANAVAVERCRQTFTDIRTAGRQDLARVSVAVRALSQLGRSPAKNSISGR